MEKSTEPRPEAMPEQVPNEPGPLRADGVLYRPTTAARLRFGPEAVQTRPLPEPKEPTAPPVKPVVIRPGSLVAARLLSKI